ncbi:MAG: hypothetical protein CMO01_11965 [Thalassobius sp.]|nr:hypothetical protein [Thalassovita sp.]
MKKIFADLHCHPAAWTFNYLRNTESEKDPELFTPWSIPASNIKRQEKGIRTGYSQSDFAKLLTSRTKLVFASLYPIEKGFFRDKFLRSLRSGKNFRTGNKHTLFDILQSKVMNVSHERTEYFQGKEIDGFTYDYWDELQREYAFYLSGADQLNSVSVLANQNKQTYQYETQGYYKVAQSLADVNEAVNSPNGISIVLTIEGMHALGIGNPVQSEDVSVQVLKERIAALKGESKTLRNWQHPIFFITFAHHFYNTLCGHAHSFPNLGEKCFLNQSVGIDTGFNDKGRAIACELLGIDTSLNDTGSRRILLDVKHMSPQARKDYYNQIVIPYNNKPGVKKKIPVIASHIGYSGAQNLQQLIDESNLEYQKGFLSKKNRADNFERDDFYAWGINVCDEDIEIAHTTGGLLGLAFDQRILGVRAKERRENNISAFLRTIERIALVPFKSDLDNPFNIWNTITIGTDFEGYINPLDPYSTSLDFPDFSTDLTQALGKLKKQNKFLFGDLEPEEIVDKICFSNAYNFLTKHFEFGFGNSQKATTGTDSMVS